MRDRQTWREDKRYFVALVLNKVRKFSKQVEDVEEKWRLKESGRKAHLRKNQTKTLTSGFKKRLQPMTRL